MKTDLLLGPCTTFVLMVLPFAEMIFQYLKFCFPVSKGNFDGARP